MVFIVQPTGEGEKMECPNCGAELISRLKEYKDFPSKIQWQNKDQTKAHFDKNGDCKGETLEVENNETSEQPQNKASQIPNSSLLDDSTKKLVSNEAELLLHVRNQVLETAQKYEKEPNLGMVWEMTSLIWSKYFGDKEYE